MPAYTKRTTEEFLEVMGKLGARLGTLVLRFPYFNAAAFSEAGPFYERLNAYLGQPPPELRFAVEFRNKHWVTEELLQILGQHRVALVLLDLSCMPHPVEHGLDLITTDFVYARLVGNRKKVDSLTETLDKIVIDQSSGLLRWADDLLDSATHVPEFFAYVSNHYAGHGPATAAELAGLVEGEDSKPVPWVPHPVEFPF